MIGRREFISASGLAILARPASRLNAAPIVTSQSSLIFATITVNGRSARALVDSGSIRGLQLSEALAKSLGLVLADSGQRTQRYQGGAKPVLSAQVETVGFGGNIFKDVRASVSVGDIEAIARQIAEPFEAILGWPLLSRSGFAIDPTGDLTSRNTPGRGLALILAAKPLPVVAGTLAGRPVTFLIDTGAPGCRIDLSLAKGAVPGTRFNLPFEIGYKPFTASFQTKDLSAMTQGLGATAVIGYQFLKQFQLIWTPASKTIWLAAP